MADSSVERARCPVVCLDYERIGPNRQSAVDLPRSLVIPAVSIVAPRGGLAANERPVLTMAPLPVELRPAPEGGR